MPHFLNTDQNFEKVILFNIGKISSNYASGDAMPSKTPRTVAINYTIYPFNCKYFRLGKEEVFILFVSEMVIGIKA